MLEEISVYKRGDDVVKSVCSSGDGEASYGEQRGEVDTGKRSKSELEPVERCALTEAAIEKDYVMMRAEQRGGD